MTTGMHHVIVQCWEIDGMPDGYSLHVDEADRRAYVAKVRGLFETSSDSERSVPRGYAYETEVDTVVFGKVKASEDGIHEYPDDIPCC